MSTLEGGCAPAWELRWLAIPANTVPRCLVVDVAPRCPGARWQTQCRSQLRGAPHARNLPLLPLQRRFFNMRLAPEEVSDQLSGFTHNAVTPIGIKTRLPIIMSHK